MKIFKEKEHAIFLKPFGIRDSLYLGVTVFLYVDLRDPRSLLKEQDLWKTVPDQLGENPVLDMGMPKPRGEVLVTGACCAPRGTRRPALEVSASVGDLRKTLHVFGDRHWTSARTISDPEPFEAVPVTWGRAFGGPGFDPNPKGKGMSPITLADGRNRVPLPNIEAPDRLIGSPSDRPEPAGFGPLEVMWLQRYRKQGTYDERWQRERWPHFPDDTNYEFFNAAPEDQFLAGYFRGDEAIEIRNMHPDMPVIQSQLPDRRIRCFATRQTDLTSEETVFEEVKTRIDTVWLFPGILRGVVLYRGTTGILDDEYADVQRLFVATENGAETPKPPAFYREEQKKALDRTVPADRKRLQAAQRKRDSAGKRILEVRKNIEEARLRALGKRPVMKRSPEEAIARVRQRLKNSHAVLDRLEALVAGHRSRHGHRLKINAKGLSNLRARLNASEGRLDQVLTRIQEAQAEGRQARQEIAGDLKRSVSSEDLRQAGVDPDDLLPGPKVNPWHDRGFSLVTAWRRNLEQHPETLEALKKLGLSRRTIQRAWLGINPEERREDRRSWGLDENADKEGTPEPLVLPAGLVLPRFREATLDRIRIRPGALAGTGRDVLIEGSDEAPLFMPALKPDGAPVVRVGGELEAWLAAQEVGDVCAVVVMERPEAALSDEAQKVVEGAPAMLLAVPADLPEAERAPWKDAFSEAVVLPIPRGKTLLQAHAEGIDVRRWILDALPGEISRPAIPLSKGKAGASAGPPRAEMEAHMQPALEEAEAARAELEGLARKEMEKHGLDYEEEVARALADEETPGQAALSFAPLVAEQRERMRVAGHLTPELESQMNEAEAAAEQSGKQLAGRYDQAAARTEAIGKTGEAGPKREERSGRERARLTREEAVHRYERGQGFAGKNLSGLDLSGLDLHGIDLSKALCRKTNFSGANLEGAVLDSTLAAGANFTGASLRRVRSRRGAFMRAVLEGADLEGADLDKTSFQEADLGKARLGESRLSMVVFQKAALGQSVWTGCRARMCLFPDADAAEAVFREARLEKCLFQKTALDRADFSGAVLGSSMFKGARGEGVVFAGADLTKARMGGQAAFAGADFTGAVLDQACFRDADLSGARFQGARIGSAMFERCDMRRADLYRVPARETRFTRSNLEGADMRGVNLFLGSLRKARIVAADLSGSNLYGVDVYKAVFGKTRVDGANLKRTQIEHRREYLPS